MHVLLDSVGDQGARDIAAALVSNTTLETLWLYSSSNIIGILLIGVDVAKNASFLFTVTSIRE